MPDKMAAGWMNVQQRQERAAECRIAKSGENASILRVGTKQEIHVYIAGPDVFYPDARAIADEVRATARRYGITALIPIDNDLQIEEKAVLSLAIFQANLAMIQRADAVIANISPFRGPSADAGTVWEIGYAYALGKKVYAFTNDRRKYQDRIPQPDGMMIEDFGNIDNLMIAHALEGIFDTAEEALATAAAAIHPPDDLTSKA